jgi:hypothetical protein
VLGRCEFLRRGEVAVLGTSVAGVRLSVSFG